MYSFHGFFYAHNFKSEFVTLFYNHTNGNAKILLSPGAFLLVVNSLNVYFSNRKIG